MKTPTQKRAPVTASDVEGWVRTAVDAALERKAVDLKVLHLEPVTDFTDYFLVMSGTNDRQVRALADSILDALRKEKIRPLHEDGLSRASGVLLDFGDCVVHIFQEDIRRFYGLERLWGDAPDVTDQLTS